MPQQILKKAADIIEARGSTHGDFRENFEMCAELWTAYLRMPIAPAQVGVMMALLKFSRDQCGDGEPEHLLDAVGYAALAGAVSRPE